MASSSALPGFNSPAVGFEQPFEMLEACHDRVRRSLTLLGKLVEYVAAHGHDAQSRSAAADVLRYFDLAAPLHHLDEETHVFPLLLEQGDAAVREAVQSLQKDHVAMGHLWLRLRMALLDWRDAETPAALTASTRADAANFSDLYTGHLKTEEGLVFPQARARLDATSLAAMGRQMQARRQG
ncbi:MAG: hemerythrin domain-containing protein [Burkholderiales bacterium]|nr:hemerythrin domain-containing protein [Burkholderiales bacterium]